MAGAIFVAMTGSALGLNGVLRGWLWLGYAIFTVGAVLLGTAVGRALRVPEVLVPVLGAGILVVVLTLEFFNSSSFLGLIPTRATLAELGPLLRLTSDTVIGGVAPVDPRPGILLVTCVGLGLATLLVDVLAVSLSMPAASGLGMLAVLLVPALVKVDSVGPLGFLGAAAGYLLILACSQRVAPHNSDRSLPAAAGGLGRRAVGIGAAAVVVTVLLPLAIPGFSSGTFPEGSHFNPFGKVSGLNPMVTLGNDLRNPNSQGQMFYATDSATPVYLRSTTLEDFAGNSWEPTDRTGQRRLDPSRMNDDVSTAAVINGTVSTTEIDSQDFSSPWLPAPYAPLSVNGLDGRWTWDPETLSIRGLDANSAHQKYTVRSVMPELTRKALSEVVNAPRDSLDKQFVELPKDTPEIIRSTALAITGTAPAPYDKAMAIQNYLRGPDFTYSEQTPAKQGYDGSGMDVLATFLQVKSGYCVHFAAAMAVMAREAGIPSRIAVGYAPGRVTGTKVVSNGTVLTRYAVDAHDAHAWPELYFEGLGWVPFEPTPSRGQVPAYAQAPVVPGADITNPDDSLTPNSASRSKPSPSDAPAVPTTTGGGGQADLGSTLRTVTWPALGALLVLLILASPYLTRQHLRRQRMALLQSGSRESSSGKPLGRSSIGGSGRRIGRPGAGRAEWSAAAAPDPAAVAWAELEDLAGDYGLTPLASDTPRGFAARLLDSNLLRKEMPEKDLSAKEVPSQEVPGRDLSAKEVPTQEVPGRDLSAKEVPTQEVPTQEVPGMDAPGTVGTTAARSVASLLQSYERSTYGPPVPLASLPQGRGRGPELAGDLDKVHLLLRAEASPALRLRARLLPASTLSRWSPWWHGRLNPTGRRTVFRHPSDRPAE
ncbi:transglutaminase domain-containing protein [Paenarthrobacter sp. Z7-10]|uniref:transglutaminase family protein n=1 Tax=Paenarthrobacter sp. Z7-10 TaxID=2787635 RepID=UPI0022A96C05|nr:DUF3488 and transglutaminase-like domain-containing protein [Paenarthrobacter sp. Z7-10]MCZ2403264.1 transglutaminase domain-containing protein [Paenarthrobacter sp. Z7-10]